MAKTFMRVQGGVAVEPWTAPANFALDKCWADPSAWVDITNADPQPQVGWQWDGRVWSPPVTVAPPIPDALARLAVVHDIVEAKGVWFQPAAATAPVLFPTDPASVGKISSSYTAAKDGQWVDGTPMRSANNLYIPMTAADVVGLAQKALSYIAQCAAAAAKLAEVIGTTNPAVDVTADNWWPSNA